jgi:hypothetical protein
MDVRFGEIGSNFPRPQGFWMFTLKRSSCLFRGVLAGIGLPVSKLVVC